VIRIVRQPFERKGKHVVSRLLDLALGASRTRGIFMAIVLAVAAAVGPTPGSPAAIGAQGTFPATITDDEGTDVTIEAEPARIISLSPANTEIVFALGAGDRLVGRTDWDDYPAEALELTPVASFTGVDMEQVVALEPDLVLAAGNSFTPPDDITRMRDLGIPVVVTYAPDVPTVMADIELIGVAIGAGDEGAALTDAMHAQFDTISQAVATVETAPRTFYQIGSEPEIYAPAPDSFVADMVSFAGGRPITTADPAAWAIPLEELIVADPEVIILGDANYGVCPDDVVTRAGWAGMTAVVNGDVRPVDDVPVTRPGPRLMQGLASLARAIHPELELPGFPVDAPMCEAD
jgi:iron complex transport system substrate-binding protein